MEKYDNIKCEDRIKKVKKIANMVFQREKLSIPVDIEKIINKYCKLECTDIPFADAICVGLEKNPIIIYAQNSIRTRLRFTLAHELGHIKISWHTGIISCHTEDENKVSASEYQEIEREANMFASEILMPTSWIQNVVQKYEYLGLKYIINYISEKAEVSLLASLYAVIDVLPEGYFIKIDRIMQKYTQKKVSLNTKLVQLYDGHFCSMKWLQINSINQENLSCGDANVYWINMRKSCDDEYLNVLFKNCDIKIDLTKIFKIIFDKDKYSPANILPKICEKLPCGFVIYIQSIDKRFFGEVKSNDTFINPQLLNDSIESRMKWSQNNSVDNGTYIIDGFEINWYKFDIEHEMLPISNDNRDANSILKNLIENVGLGEQKGKISPSIHSTIKSSYEKYKGKYVKEELYKVLKQRFFGIERLKLITENSDFDIFLMKKINELYNKN